MRWNRICSALAAVLAIGACASSPQRSCRPGEGSAVLDSLYFGTGSPAGAVTPEQWRGFVSQVVTPRFPQGLTSWEASGQWQTATGVIEREASHILQMVHPDTEESELAVREITSRYKAEFQQEAVLRVRSTICMSF